MRGWLAQHGEAARLALRRLASAQRLAGITSAAPQITVFMAANADRAMAAEIESRLKKRGDIKRIQFLPREETLARMKANPGLREVIEALAANPFPDAFVLTAADEGRQAQEQIVAEVHQWPRIEHVQLDSDWVRRLDALLELGRTALLVLDVLLGIGLIAISFSIIRMQVLSHRAEIELSGLLGATDSFIRRPLLYYGFLLGLGGGIVAWLLVGAATLWLRAPLGELVRILGLGGGIVAWLLVGAATLWLRAPLGELVRMYDLTLSLQAPGPRDSALLLAVAAGLGWLGAIVSLRQQLRQKSGL